VRAVQGVLVGAGLDPEVTVSHIITSCFVLAKSHMSPLIHLSGLSIYTLRYLFFS